MSLGPQLGPMSRGDLEELTRSGSVLKTDQVRQGEDGYWRPAVEVRGLFDSAANAVPEVDSATKAERAPDVVPPRDDSTEQGTPRENKAADETVVAAGTSPEVNEEAAKLEALLPAPSDSLRDVDEEDFELNLPEPTPPDKSHAVADSETMAEPPVKTEQAEVSGSRESPTPPLRPVVESSQSDPVAESTTTIPPLPQTQPRQQRPLRRVPRWWPRAVGLAAILIGVAFAFPLLVPDPDPQIYNRFSSLYAEWLQHRLNMAKDPWPEFAERARAEIDESIPWLEEHAQPGDRGRSLLLFAGRDLRKALDSPPGQAVPGERRLKGLFEQLDEIHAPAE